MVEVWHALLDALTSLATFVKYDSIRGSLITGFLTLAAFLFAVHSFSYGRLSDERAGPGAALDNLKMFRIDSRSLRWDRLRNHSGRLLLASGTALSTSLVQVFLGAWWPGVAVLAVLIAVLHLLATLGATAKDVRVNLTLMENRAKRAAIEADDRLRREFDEAAHALTGGKR